jgi:hypothetical protein
MTSLHHDPGVSSGRVSTAAVFPSDLTVLSEPFGPHHVGCFRVQQHLKEKLARLLAPGGAWHACRLKKCCSPRVVYTANPKPSVLSAVARVLIAGADHRGVTWPGEEYLVEQTGLGYSSVHKALGVIAGAPGEPGALFSRRHLNSGEVYERDGKPYMAPTYFYFADLSAAVGSAPRLVSSQGVAADAGRGDLLSHQIAVVRPAGCVHSVPCRSRAACSKVSLPAEYFTTMRATS